MAIAPVAGFVAGEVVLHDVSVTFFLYAAGQDLQHQPEPPVHGLEVGLDEEGGEAIAEQRLLHDGAELVFLFG